jgi:hypothetical protein
MSLKHLLGTLPIGCYTYRRFMKIVERSKKRGGFIQSEELHTKWVQRFRRNSAPTLRPINAN